MISYFARLWDKISDDLKRKIEEDNKKYGPSALVFFMDFDYKKDKK